MRGSVLLSLALALLAPAAARAQEAVSPELAARVNRVLNDAATDRRDGASTVPAGEVVAASLGVMDGTLELAGEVEGDVVVVNGDLVLRPGAVIGGEAIVIGGRVEGAGGARIGAGVRAIDEPVIHCRRAGMVDVTGRCAALPAAAAPAEGGETWTVDAARRPLRFLLATGRSYNRVEGLPVRFGLAWESPGRTPTRLRAEGIYRTESGAALGPTRWGYAVGAEQEVGGGVRVGVRAQSLVDAIEAWHVTDLENSLATFFLKRDFRDHFERQGWAGYLSVRPEGSPWSGTLQVARERHRTLPAGSPWALFRNAEPWRPQPLVGEGVLVSATASARLDTRSEAWDPAAGWLVAAEVEQALSSTLARTEYLPPLPGGGEPTSIVEPYGRFTRLWVDVRRYNRISPSSRLNLRAAAGGALTRRRLPPQRQHALGGEGTLPGYPLFSLDCGARDDGATTRDNTGAPDEARFFPAYGCDRLLLAQVEYRSDLSVRIPLPAQGGEPSAMQADLSWVLFADAAAGWGADGYLGNERAALDVGTGLQWGDFGVYAALPVGARAHQGTANLFVRLAPRF